MNRELLKEKLSEILGEEIPFINVVIEDDYNSIVLNSIDILVLIKFKFIKTGKKTKLYFFTDLYGDIAKSECMHLIIERSISHDQINNVVKVLYFIQGKEQEIIELINKYGVG